MQVQSKGIYLTTCLIGPTETQFTDKSLSEKTISMEILKTKMKIGKDFLNFFFVKRLMFSPKDDP